MSDEKTTTSISFKLGNAEFSANGPTEIVNTQFQAFLAALDKTPQQEKREVEDDPNQKIKNSPANAGEINQQMLARIFSKDADDRISLKALSPSGAADSLVLLLYGFEALIGAHAVTATALMRAANKSGIKLDRIDRVIAPNLALITTAGARRGKRYGLNNRGKQHAEKILREVLE